MTKRLLVSLIFMITILTGCSLPVDEAAEEAYETFEEIITAEPEETNFENDVLKAYIPKDFTTEEESENNIILSDSSITAVLFVNPHEDLLSQVAYETLMDSEEDPLYVKTMEQDDMFSYIVITEADKSLYDVTVGIGGVKLSTQMKARKITGYADEFATIVRSVTYDVIDTDK
ncbi:hypothetical protein EJF36_15700 [Bacillus sp. HMF5848]|uniref:hypothetical protein n=1 Tax=Bacillus sp. HMF5848 TaxID=2495421 RepID=UPI000F7B637E|nr:hypothetical protein [Bacillus sp. HMF5848]RSK28213.1 hypothetical protein EJF36_15700 [Bacillus sp. HMF5848]